MILKKDCFYTIREDGLVEKQYWNIEGKLKQIRDNDVILISLKNKRRRYLVDKKHLKPIKNNIIKI